MPTKYDEIGNWKVEKMPPEKKFTLRKNERLTLNLMAKAVHSK